MIQMIISLGIFNSIPRSFVGMFHIEKPGNYVVLFAMKNVVIYVVYGSTWEL